MERRNGKGVWLYAGKIAGLATFAETHREAINYDLLTRTGYEIKDIGSALSWGAFESFIKNVGPDSALGRELGYATGWETTKKTNAILADIYDLLQVINYNLVSAHSRKKRPKKNIKPYPRPGQDEKNERKIGKGALPINDLREWINNKRKEKKKGGKK